MARSALWMGLALAVPLVGCRACGSNDGVVARLAEVHGQAGRSGSGVPEQWSGASPGASFVIGDAVRTETASTAKVDLVAGGALRLSEKTLVRFLPQGTAIGLRRVHVETGEAEVESGGAGLDIDTAIGAAQIEPGARVMITATSTEARFQVMVGRAQIDIDGGAMKLEAGQRFAVSTGVAVVDPSLSAAKPDAASPADAGEVEAGLAALVDVDVRGEGVRVGISRQGALAPLAAGKSQLAEGARLVVPDGASVEVSRGSERATVAGRADVLVGHQGSSLLEARSGRVMVTSPSAGTQIAVPGGSIVLAAVGSGTVQAQVTIDRGTARVLSNQGSMELRGRQGAATLGPGQSGTLDGSGVAVADVSAPSAADVTIPGGESPVIHSPRGVAAVRIRFQGACPGDALVDVGAGRATRTMFVGGALSAAVVPLAVGSYGYRVRCVESGGLAAETREPRQSGTIEVVRDGGAAPLPRTAPRDVIDADGRKYSVLYQNVLPQITVRWPRAPAERPSSLHIELTKGRLQTIAAPSGTAALPAGALGEGAYRFWFAVDGDDMARSPDTTLRISFDNAAPTAEVKQPLDGQPVADPVHVSGIAIEGASVSVNGVPVQLDPEFRFRGDVSPPAGDRSIAIRIAHPLRGVHYYLRSFGGA